MTRTEEHPDQVERLRAACARYRSRLNAIYDEVAAVIGPLDPEQVDDLGLAESVRVALANASQRAARRAADEVQPTRAMLAEFHARPGCDQAQPTVPTLDVPGGARRAEYVLEEALELRDAVAAGDLVKVADALADVVYAAYGTAWRMGIPLDSVIAEVHRSNMTKTPAPGDGKAIKGTGYSPPEIAGVLGLEVPA